MQGKLEIQAKNFLQAQKIFQKVLLSEKNETTLSYSLKCEMELKNFQAALLLCEEILRLNKSHFFQVSIKKLSCLIQMGLVD